MRHSLFSWLILVFCIGIMVACSPSKKDFRLQIHSDPLGAYALMKVQYKEDLDTDWVFLGPTPINHNKVIAIKGASAVSIKVIRPGFFDQEKSWKLKEFLKEHKQKKSITWIPNLVQQ